MINRLPLRKLFLVALFMLGIMAAASNVWADGKPPQDAPALAKASQNPVASLISLPFENNATFNNGAEDVFVNILNIKPVIPMGLTEDWNLIHRAIVPVMYVDDGLTGPVHTWGGATVTFIKKPEEEGSLFGLGDIVYQGFLSPAKPGKFIWGVGPELHIPTGMDSLTSDQWSLGPAAVGLTMPGPWVIGLLASNFWSIGGYNDPPDVNELTAQYFINYNMKGGWYLSSAPVIKADWEADSGDKWTVPFGGGIGRVFKIGEQHVNMKAAAYYSAVKPDNASDWNLQFTLTFLFPKGK